MSGVRKTLGSVGRGLGFSDNPFSRAFQGAFGKGGKSGKGGSPPVDASQSNTDIRAFREELARRNPQFFYVGQQLIDRGLGEADPRFEAFRQGQFGLLNEQRDATLNAERANLTRRGITGSVGMNQQARTNQGFNTRQSALSGGIGLASLANQNQNLQGGFQLQQSGLQNLLGPAGLSIALLNAQNAGRDTGKK